MKLFAIYDRIADQYENIFQSPTPGTAERMIVNAMRQDQSQLRDNRADYELWQLGEFDQQKGEITPNKQLLVKLGQINIGE